MRYLILVVFTAIIFAYHVAGDCCGFDGISSCCGGGNCNIFCCNCDEVCRATCPEKCLDLCRQGCPPLPDDPRNWKWLDQQCIIECDKTCTPAEDAKEETTPLAWRIARSVFRGGSLQSDEAIFAEVDVEGVGYFSYQQFLQRQSWPDNEGARAHFGRYDVDGDGLITIGEMRPGNYLY